MSRAWGTAGKYQELAPVKQGATFRKTLRVSNPDGTAANLAGCVFRGQIRKTPDGPVVATITCTIDVVTATVLLYMSAATTLAIPCGRTADSPASQYVWDLKIIDAANEEHDWFYGPVTMEPAVTKAPYA
jgi:hypothetical protein